MNRVVLVGRLTKDPGDLRRSVTTENATISFTLAVDTRSKQEDRQTAFISCVAFNKTAEFIESYFRKGLLVGVEGRLQTRNYENSQGNKVYVTEVVCDNVQILEPKGTRENALQENPSSNYEEPARVSLEQPKVGIDIDDDELPF